MKEGSVYYNLIINNESLDIKNFVNIATKFQEKAKRLGLVQNSSNNTTIVSSNQEKDQIIKKTNASNSNGSI